MSLPGKYLYYDQENFFEHMKKNGIKIDLQSLFESKGHTLDIKQDGDKYTIVRTVGDDTKELNFKLNEEFVESFFGKDFVSKATLENNVLKVSTTEDRKRFYNVTDKGLEVLFISPNGQATLKYKRI